MPSWLRNPSKRRDALFIAIVFGVGTAVWTHDLGESVFIAGAMVLVYAVLAWVVGRYGRAR